MSTIYRYALPVELTEWKFDGRTETHFTWEYEDERAVAARSSTTRARSSNGTRRRASTGRTSSIPRIRCSSTTASIPICGTDRCGTG